MMLRDLSDFIIRLLTKMSGMLQVIALSWNVRKVRSQPIVLRMFTKNAKPWKQIPSRLRATDK